jgi:hypothetical protein
MKYLIFIIAFFGNMYLLAQIPNFEGPRDLGIVDYKYVNEASGIVASRMNNQILWTHNDEGNDPRIFAINTSAQIVAIYYLNLKDGRDFEDITIGKGTDSDDWYLYLGDIGDNNKNHEKKFIYRFKEPKVDASQNLVTDTIYSFDKITFKLPDIYDSEAMMFDPITKDIIIISKREKKELVFKLPYPHSTTKTMNAEEIAEVPFGYEGFNGSGVTAADISEDGTEILIKTYSKVYYYSRDISKPIEKAFDKKPAEVNYTFEPQGEAICWHPKSVGYFTLSEMSPFEIPPHLYYYERNGTTVKKKVKKKKK